MKKRKILLILVVCFFVFFRWYIGTKNAFEREYNITSSEVEVIKTKPLYKAFITDIRGPTWTIFKFDKRKKSLKEIFVFNEKEIDEEGLKNLSSSVDNVVFNLPSEVKYLFKDCKEEDIDFIEYRGISHCKTFIINLKTGYGVASHDSY